MNKIYLLGLGPGEYDQISLRVLNVLKKAPHLYVRTADHPAVQTLVEKNIPMTFFDDFYEEMSEDFEKVYEKIVNTLIEQSEKETIYYAVPGHPRVAERTVALLSQRVPERLEVVGGQSFLDDLFQAVNIDPVEGFQLLDAFSINHQELQPRQHVVIMQVAHSLIASHVKMELMERYPDEHDVYIVDAAGTSFEQVTKIPLYELDYFDEVNNLRSVYVPPLSRDENKRDFSTLIEYMQAIHDENAGDVWILGLTQKDLVAYLKQEIAEYEEAIIQGDADEQAEELGDILMVLINSMMALEKEEYYSVLDVIEKINQKVRFRHPHVFDGVEAKTPEEVDAIWQERKRLEKEGKKDES